MSEKLVTWSGFIAPAFLLLFIFTAIIAHEIPGPRIDSQSVWFWVIGAEAVILMISTSFLGASVLIGE